MFEPLDLTAKPFSVMVISKGGDKVPKKIVIIEDNAGLRETIAEVFRVFDLLRGTEVCLCATAEEGLSAVSEDSSVVAVMTDIGLLGDDDDSGLDVIKVVKRQWPSVPVIGMSGRPAMAAETLATGANCFLAKPFMVSGLKVALVKIGLLKEE